jgi:hypothetical protein
MGNGSGSHCAIGIGDKITVASGERSFFGTDDPIGGDSCGSLLSVRTGSHEKRASRAEKDAKK